MPARNLSRASVRRLAAVSAPLLALASPQTPATQYGCDDYTDTETANFYVPRAGGQTLDQLVATTETPATGKAEKAALLSGLAVGIYLDETLDTATEVRLFALDRCPRECREHKS
jgi:hypothetical protein